MQRENRQIRSGFALMELAIIVLVIVLLITLTLPMIALSRDQSMISVSKDNLRQLSMAHRMYAADHNDNQWTVLPHDLATYGSSAQAALHGWCEELQDAGTNSGTCVGYAASSAQRMCRHQRHAMDEQHIARECS